MITLLSRSACAKISFFLNGIFLLQNLFKSDFWLGLEISASELTPVQKFQLHWTKDKGTPILTSNDTKNKSMTSYLPPSDGVSKIFRVFERIRARVPLEKLS